MKVKTAEIQVNKETLDGIIENWKHHSFANNNSQLIDEINPFDVKLRVAYEAKGNHIHMNVLSQVKISKTNNKIFLSLHCSMLKLILMFSVIMLLGSVVLFFLNKELLSSIVLSVIFASAYSAYFFTKITRASNRFLSALKEHSR